jgi:Ca-activated chloride channel family protein
VKAVSSSTSILISLTLAACSGDPTDAASADPSPAPPAAGSAHAPAQPQTIPAHSPFVAIEPDASTPPGTTAPLRIAYASVHVAISGGIAHTIVDEVMVNDQPAPVEAAFSFPLPDDATITDFADWRDGKRVAASLTGKEAARDRFDKAAAEGKTASLGEQDGRTFQMKLAPVPGHGQRRVELAYTQTVASLGGERTWTLPAKHYTDQVPTHLDLAVDLDADREITGARELNHDDVRIERASLSHSTVFLARSRRSLERDVVVRWSEPTADLDLAGRAARRSSKEPAYVTARFGFERDPAAATRDPMNVVLVLDRSLSMAGEPLAHAAELADGILDGLDPRDSVGLVAFAADVHTITLAPADVGHRQQIHTELSTSVASGASNLAAALDEATAMVGKAPNSVVVLMTDGQPTTGDGVDADLPVARAADVAKARVVIAHFNYPSREQALERLFPGAQLHYVPDGRAGASVVRQLTRLAIAPSIEGLHVTVDGAVADTTQGVVPSLIAMGEEVRIAARADHDVTIHVTGTLHGKPVALSQTIAVPAAAAPAGDDGGLGVEWARLRIADLERRYRDGETTLSGEIGKLGTEYRLATMFTSFVADDDSLSPDRIRPGDPEIRVRAPRSAQAVYAVLPWGDVVRCDWQDAEGLWLGRFLVPRGAREGTYRVRVFTNTQGKVVLRGTLLYRVDEKPPTFTLDATYDRGVLHLRATPANDVIDSPGLHPAPPAEPVGAQPRLVKKGDSIRPDLVDLKRAVVRLDGKDVELTRDGDVWTAELVVALTGKVTLSLVTTDYAGNAATAVKVLDTP